MIIMLAMIAVFYGIVIAILYITKQQTQPTFNEYAVGGRSYGPWYVAMSYVNSWWPGATFIALFGLAAGVGVLGMYALAYSILGVAFMYLMATRAWRWGKKYDLRTQPDLLGHRFQSIPVKRIASVIGVLSMFPWVVLGMQALGKLMEFATEGNLSVTTCLAIGLALIIIRQYWTVTMGMRGLILTDMFQGAVAYVLAAVVCVVLLVSSASPVSFGDLATIADANLRLPGDGGPYGAWYVFSLILTGTVGSLCWPTSFQRIYTASGVRSVKAATVRTVLISGIFYTLLMLVALAASQVADVGATPQDGWFTVLNQFGGTWLLGLGVVIVFAASMGHIDGVVQVCGLQIANDIIGGGKRQFQDSQLTKIAKASMVVYMALAGVAAYALFSYSNLQQLAIISYQGIVQLSVPLFLGIFWRGGNKHGAAAGMLSGFAVAAVLTWIYPDDIVGLGSLTGGIVGLAVNLVVFLAVSAATGQSETEKALVDEFFESAKPPAQRVAPSTGIGSRKDSATAT